MNLPPRELLLLLFCLSKDAESSVRQQASQTLLLLPDETFACLSTWNDPHPAILHYIALVCGLRTAVRAIIRQHPAAAEVTLDELTRQAAVAEQQGCATATAKAEDGEENGDEAALPPSEEAETETEEQLLDENGEEYLSKYKLAQAMGIGEKIKMALTGDKEWRKILIKDANKLVSSGVLKNPRITEAEVLTVLKSGVQNDEVMRLICANKEWVKNYQIRKALIENPKTPLASALRFLGTMSEKDVAGYAKSRNISSVIATQAKRLTLNKKH